MRLVILNIIKYWHQIQKKNILWLKDIENWAILRSLCECKEVEIIQAEVIPDHLHMPSSIQPKLCMRGFIRYLKEQSSIIIYQKYAKLKF